MLVRRARHRTQTTDHLPITLITSIKMVISPVVSTSVSARANINIYYTTLHPVALTITTYTYLN